LTTNRVGTIDPAFKSRLHLSLYYPRLDKHKTIAIWKNHLQRLQKQFKEEKKKIQIDKKDILQFARGFYRERESQRFPPWNGRQIRNAFQTAMALAEYDARSSTIELSRHQFEKVAQTSQQFDQYMKNVWGGRDDAIIAQQDQIRVDSMRQEHLNPVSAAPVHTPAMTAAAATSLPTTGGSRAQASKSATAQSRRSAAITPQADPSSDDDDDDDDDEDEDDNQESEEDEQKGNN
jgi:hypothetical protein